MATVAELEAAYEVVTRTPPNTAQKLILSDMAVASQNGVITDDQAYAYVLKQADGTTTVAALTYQFFTGKLPTEAGFDYLVSSTDNVSDLNDAYFQGFNFENRFINFAVNLGINGEGKTAFQAKYGALSMREAVEVAYNEIIGIAQAQDAGIDVQAAIGSIVGRANYFASIVYPAPPPGAPIPQQDGLAVKAAMVGYIMAEAVKAKVGVYSNGVSNFYLDLADDGEADFNADLNDYVTSGGGSGGPGIPGNAVVLDFDASYDVAPGQFTDNDDTATGEFGPSALGDTFLNTGNGADRLGTATDFVQVDGFPGKTLAIDLGGGNDNAWILLSEHETTIIDGGAGTDTLTLDGSVSDWSTIRGFENVVIDTGTATIDFDSFSDVKTLTIKPDAASEIEVLNLDDDVAVTFAGEGGIFIEYASESGAITLGASKLGRIAAAGDLEDTLTLVATRAATVGGIDISASTLVVKGNYSLNLGIVELGGDERTIDLSAVNKDVSLFYVASQETETTLLLGGGDDSLGLIFDGQVAVTLGAGDDTVTIDADSSFNIGEFGADGMFETLTQITDFDVDEDAIVMSAFSGYRALSAGFFIGVAETDEAQFAKVHEELAGQANDSFTAFEAADGSGVFIYGNATAGNAFDDWYVKLVGVSLDELRITDDAITGA
ncbi:hypothetical protein [Caulobacter sp. NIBR2454]|uniref:hypothetical protein n=1 Tax=Caulobacter sp. NIBR2454 TaxID=3015996 RepID=UPI0022B6CBB4|nr:hypothetical protein [Caulobacter sp. NIBR2454]